MGGDFYDFVPLGDGRLGIVIADVSDKGMSAALFMALSRSIVRASVSHGSSTARSLERANRLICADAHDGMFVTLLYGIIDADGATFRYTNAGHTPPVVLTTDGLYTPGEHGQALGIDETSGLHEHSLSIGPGDVIVLYTDGVTDAINEADEQFGVQRLLDIVSGCRSLPPEAIIARVTEAVAQHAGAAPAFDDATIVVAKRVQD